MFTLIYQHIPSTLLRLLYFYQVLRNYFPYYIFNCYEHNTREDSKLL